MITCVKTNYHQQDFVSLVKELDAYLKITDGDEHEFYNQFNSINALKNVVVAYKKGEPIGCGAFKPFNEDSVEIKRMYTISNARNQGVASNVLETLENWAREIGYSYTILETGIRQKEAVEFYKKSGYLEIPKYGQYKNMDNSLCFKKKL